MPTKQTWIDSALDAIGDGTRRVILERLKNGPQSVADLTSTMTISRPAVSQHLKVLKDAGLVVDQADGTRRIYELNPEGIERLQTYTAELWESALGRFQKLATKNTKQGKNRT